MLATSNIMFPMYVVVTVIVADTETLEVVVVDEPIVLVELVDDVSVELVDDVVWTVVVVVVGISSLTIELSDDSIVPSPDQAALR